MSTPRHRTATRAHHHPWKPGDLNTAPSGRGVPAHIHQVYPGEQSTRTAVAAEGHPPHWHLLDRRKGIAGGRP